MLHFHDLDHMEVNRLLPFLRLCGNSMSECSRTCDGRNLLTEGAESSKLRQPRLRQVVWQEPG